MVGESGTGKAGNKYYYYTCLTHRRTTNPCKLKSVDKKWLEDLVVNYTWALLVDTSEPQHCEYDCVYGKQSDNECLFYRGIIA